MGPNFFVIAQQCKNKNMWTLLKVIVTKNTEIIYGKQFLVFVFPQMPSREICGREAKTLGGDFYKFATTYSYTDIVIQSSKN